ncbi:acyl-CoA N-acyltransferase [Thamnocephalis sphaerospora]|uniref:Histone acetyltransferase type B catalytic subunit n=1 Tax=Thamnocephalis sphaerospora TaxID=78915 RepID=A0A4P9XW17_9FUNG|nr:acyl-CoA N-acyltransferase [Thamnocephalis sphaerospora]|eukprot:RKP09791.1 acyl-CoA N-acyltransferase [Thamnocephalis sphaerospora]
MNTATFAKAIDTTEWVCSSNEAVQLRLVADEYDLSSSADDFGPEFTYPIFGEKEQVYGYRDLHINLYFSANSLYLYVDIAHAGTIDARIGEADNVEKLLAEFLPSDTAYTRDVKVFKKQLERDALEFSPAGELVHEYSAGSDEQTFQVYSGRFDTPEMREHYERIRLFPVFYIEGATFIDEEPRWEIVTLYEKTTREGRTQYRFIGVCTMYHFFCYPDHERVRISQFLILPPYQGQGHGSRLYNTICDRLRADSKVIEITVEDPSESFSDMRDKNDLRRLMRDSLLSNAEAPVARSVIEKLRKEHKLSKRQVERCVEMALLRRVPLRDERRFRPYRLQVKKRLYQFNRDALATLEKKERQEKLQETFEGVIEDYRRILDAVQANNASAAADA